NRYTETDTSIDEEAREIDLGATRDEVVEALRQLEVEKSKMDPGQYEIERQQLLARGAKALRELDDEASAEEERDEPAPARPADEPVASPSEGLAGLWHQLAPEWRGALTALGAVAVVGLLFMGLRSDTRERREGDPITGSDIVTSGNQRPAGLERANPQIVAQIEALEIQLQEDSQNVITLNGLTQLYLSANVPEKAMEYNTSVLEVDPKNKDGRAYRGVLRMMMGMGDKAVEAFDEVLAEDGQHLLSLFYKGLVLLELRRFDEAVGAFEAALAVDPNNPNLARALADAKGFASGKPPPGPAPAADGELIVRGTLDIDPALRSTVPSNAVLFASVRGPSGQGAPVAAIKLAPRFPQPFQISTADMRAMGGGANAVPDQLTLTIRVDLDGNAMTREDAPKAVVTGIRRGADGLTVTLTSDGAASASPPAAAAGGGETLAAGTLTLAPGADTSGVLFVSLRPVTGGPPVAAKQIRAPSFPLTFELTKRDMIPMMAGRPLPGELILKAHIDRDGNAGTKEDGPAAVMPSVKVGTTDLQLRLE
ncbi:MAG: tetratricopeptide repeat protein, partial [Myxococcota bacterium]